MAIPCACGCSAPHGGDQPRELWPCVRSTSTDGGGAHKGLSLCRRGVVPCLHRDGDSRTRGPSGHLATHANAGFVLQLTLPLPNSNYGHQKSLLLWVWRRHCTAAAMQSELRVSPPLFVMRPRDM